MFRVRIEIVIGLIFLAGYSLGVNKIDSIVSSIAMSQSNESVWLWNDKKIWAVSGNKSKLVSNVHIYVSSSAVGPAVFQDDDGSFELQPGANATTIADMPGVVAMRVDDGTVTASVWDPVKATKHKLKAPPRRRMLKTKSTKTYSEIGKQVKSTLINSFTVNKSNLGIEINWAAGYSSVYRNDGNGWSLQNPKLSTNKRTYSWSTDPEPNIEN